MNTVSDVVQRAKKLGVESLNDTMTNQWLEEFLFPEKQAIEKGYFPVDWAGTTLDIMDHSTGETIPAYVFIATLPYSQFSYVEAFLDMKSANWLIAHIHALEYFGGVPETLVPDNLKTGVTKAHREEPLLNEA